jgi:hypothetical protein
MYIYIEIYIVIVYVYVLYVYIEYIYIHQFISYDCFAKCFANCVPTNPLDYSDIFCRSTDRDYRLCEIFSDNHEIAIIA